MSRVKSSQYIYAVSRIRAIEKRLLDRGKLDRMVDARTPEEALKVLLEADYGNASPDAAGAADYESILTDEYKKVYKLLREMAPDAEVFDLFLQIHDFHNAKVILKAEFLQQELSDKLMMNTGSMDAAKLKAMIRDRSMAQLPDVLRKAVEEGIDVFNRTGDPQAIDLILDQACYRHMKEMASGWGNDFLNEYVTITIDLINIKMFLRLKRLQKSWDFLQKALLQGGNITPRVYIEKMDTPLEEFVAALRFTPYGSMVDAGVESLKVSGSLTKLEQLADNYLMNFIRKSKYMTFGLEPMVGYLVAKETEIKNARIIMVGKLNNIPNETIRERLREVYV